MTMTTGGGDVFNRGEEQKKKRMSFFNKILHKQIKENIIPWGQRFLKC